MKNLFLIFIFFQFSVLAFAQGNQMQYTSDSDTAFWLKYRQAEEAFIGIPPIPSEADLAFRLSTYCTSLTVYRKTGIYEGSATFYVEGVDNFTDSTEIFKKEFGLSVSQIEKIFRLTDSLKILSIPSYKNIPCWGKNGLDGIVYTLEYKSKDTISIKNYWSPDYQSNCDAAQTIQFFIDALKIIIENENLHVSFDQSNPFIRWHCPGSPGWSVKILTPRQHREFLKEKEGIFDRRK